MQRAVSGLTACSTLGVELMRRMSANISRALSPRLDCCLYRQAGQKLCSTIHASPRRHDMRGVRQVRFVFTAVALAVRPPLSQVFALSTLSLGLAAHAENKQGGWKRV